MDIDKATKEAQRQLDDMLAEVARLKTEAKEIEENNEAAVKASHEVMARLRRDVAVLDREVGDTRRVVRGLTQEIKNKEMEKKSVSDLINTRREDLIELNKRIEVKEDRLKSLEKSGAEKVRKVDAQLEEKKAELRGLEQDIFAMESKYQSEENRLKTKLNKLKKEVHEEEALLSQKQDEVAVALDKAKRHNKDAVATEAKRKEAEQAAAKAEAELKAAKANIEQNAQTLESLKKQVKEVDAELKTLNMKRMESKNFIDELHAKEANLRKKYEDVGLEYK